MQAEETAVNVTTQVRAEDLQPLVKIEYLEQEIEVQPNQAAYYGISILTAIGHAQSELSVVRSVNKLMLKEGIDEESGKLIGVLIAQIREDRAGLISPEISAMVGYMTGLPLVVINYPGFPELQLRLEEAAHHAQALLQASESAVFDGFMYKFGTNVLCISLTDVEGILKSMMEYRENLARAVIE